MPQLQPLTRLLLTVCCLSVCAIVSSQAVGQVLQISGVVETSDGKHLAHVSIRITSLGGTTTSDSGEFVLHANILPGQAIEFSLPGDWVILSPWEGRTFAPRLGSDPIHVRVARRGDSRLLRDSQFVQDIIAGATSQPTPILSSNATISAATQVEDYLASKAKETGLSIDQLRTAIDSWVMKVQGPYQKGLAAQYKKQFVDASRLFNEAILASENDLFPMYLALANSEISEGNFHSAESAYRKALGIHPQYTEALAGLGWALMNQDRFAEARSAVESALELDESADPDNHALVARRLNLLASLGAMSGNFSEAEIQVQRALNLIRQTPNTNALAGAYVLSNLAEIQRELGRFSIAETNALASLTILSDKLGPSDLARTDPLTTLSLIYASLGEFGKAMDASKEVRDMHSKALGKSHPNVVRDTLDLAVIYMFEHDYASAQRVLEGARLINRDADRANTLEAAGILCNLGIVDDELGELSEARPLLEQALAISQSKLGARSFRVAIVERGLGILSVDEKKYTEAETHLSLALGIDMETFGPIHPTVAWDYDALGFLEFSVGSFDKAAGEYARAYNVFCAIFGPVHADVGRAAAQVALALRKQGKDAEAVQYDEAVARARKAIEKQSIKPMIQ